MEPLGPGDPGELGEYRLLARIGAGGMGVVYLGYSPGGRLVAVKVVRERFAWDFEYRARFRREVSAARKVTGAFTAPVLDADPQAESPWLATAYLPGLSLREAVTAFGGIPPAGLRTLAAGLMEALADIHRAGLAHRDLKPENVLLTAGGPRVIDFGIARPEDATAITRVGGRIGTPGFMSPEQMAGGETGPASDLFSLGAVLVFAATGKEAPGSGPTGSRLPGTESVVPGPGVFEEPDLHRLVVSCLHRDPRQRPTAAEALDRLGAVEVSSQGTGWLPPPMAEAIDRRTAEARLLSSSPVGGSFLGGARLGGGPMAGGSPDLDPAGSVAMPSSVSAASIGAASAEAASMGEATVDAPAVPSPGPAGGTAGSGAAGSRGMARRALIGAGAVGLLAAGAGAARWRSGRDDHAGRPGGRAGAASSRSPSPSASPSPPVAASRWKVKVGDYYPNLSVAGGKVVAKGDNDIRAVDPRTRRILWKRSTNSPSATTADAAYVTTPVHGWLSKINPGSGAEMWTFQPPFPEIALSMVSTGSVLCYGNSRIRALDSGNGRTRWTSTVSAEKGIAAGGGVVVAAGSELVGLKADNGRKMWTYQIEQGYYPSIGGGLVFINDQQGILHAVRTDNGKRAWSRPGYGFGSPLQVGRGMAFAGIGGGITHGLDAATGALVWSRRLGHGEGDGYGQANSLSLSGGTLYVGGTDRNVYALDPADGRVLWTFGADSTVSTSGPVATAGLVFIGTKDGYVEALSAPKGGAGAST